MKVFILVLLALIQLNALSQRDFRQGYIITNEFDTIYGEILYSTNANLVKKCDFRKTGTTDSRIYMPNEIFGFRFLEGKSFISKERPDQKGQFNFF